MNIPARWPISDTLVSQLPRCPIASFTLSAAEAPTKKLISESPVTAAAINALTVLEGSQPNHGVADVPAAIERALIVLAAMQDDDGLFNAPDDRTDDDRAAASAAPAHAPPEA